MKPRVNILVSCANRKRFVAADELCLRNIKGQSIERRLAQWTSRFEAATANGVAALDLYMGEYWSVVRALPEAAEHGGWSPTLWILSAGAGLIHADDEVPPYAATFSSGQPDSVSANGRSEEESQLWWRGICRMKVKRSKRTLRSLMSSEPRSKFLFALSPAYLTAISEDLIQALREGGGDRTMIVTSPSLAAHPFEESLVTSVARLRIRLGGTLGSLHARVAHRILQDGQLALSAPEVRVSYERLAKRIHEPERRDVVRLSDDEVSSFVREALRREPQLSATRCLRRLRDMGKSCEQARFRHIFEAVVE